MQLKNALQFRWSATLYSECALQQPQELPQQPPLRYSLSVQPLCAKSQPQCLRRSARLRMMLQDSAWQISRRDWQPQKPRLEGSEMELVQALACQWKPLARCAPHAWATKAEAKVPASLRIGLSCTSSPKLKTNRRAPTPLTFKLPPARPAGQPWCHLLPGHGVVGSGPRPREHRAWLGILPAREESGYAAWPVEHGSRLSSPGRFPRLSSAARGGRWRISCEVGPPPPPSDADVPLCPGWRRRCADAVSCLDEVQRLHGEGSGCWLLSRSADWPGERRARHPGLGRPYGLAAEQACVQRQHHPVHIDWRLLRLGHSEDWLGEHRVRLSGFGRASRCGASAAKLAHHHHPLRLRFHSVLVGGAALRTRSPA